MSSREELKRRYEAYREAAKKKVVEGECLAVVTDTANVMLVDDGAFVEAVIFVSAESIDLQEAADAKKRR